MVNILLELAIGLRHVPAPWYENEEEEYENEDNNIQVFESEVTVDKYCKM